MLKAVIRNGLWLSLLVLLAGCQGGQRPTHDTPKQGAELRHLQLLSEYRIGVGDGLQVVVWRNPELSAQVIVLPDGQISVPLVGNVLAAGETTETLGERITDVLNTYIREPKVTVTVLSPSSSEYLQRVRIVGAVNGAQSLPFRRGMTVLDLVLIAGGVTPFANGNMALLYREAGEEGGVQVFRIRLDDILNQGRLDTNYELAPADIITVPEGRF